MKNNLVFIVGVCDVKGSTNIAQTRAFLEEGYSVIPINYRTIIKNYGMQFFEKFLVESVNKYKPRLIIFSKCNGINPELVKFCSQYSVTWLWNMDPVQTIEQCPEVLEHAKNADFSSCTGEGVTNWFSGNGVMNCITLREGLDTYHFKPVPSEEQYKADISFIGTKTEERDYVISLLKSKGYDIKTYGSGYSKEVYDEEFAKVCSSSKFMLSINTFSDIDNYFSDRLIRYMGCGSCVFHYDPTKTLNSLFEDGKDIIYFHTLDEIVDKLKAFEDVDTSEIRQNARKKIIENYTWQHIIKKMLNIIDPIKKRVLIKYHHGLGDVIALTPHLRYFYNKGYIVDILGEPPLFNSHLLDNCPYIRNIETIQNPWRTADGSRLSTAEEYKKIDNKNTEILKSKDGYNLKYNVDHANIPQDIPKVQFNSIQLGITENIDYTKEVFISETIDKQVKKEAKERFPKGYAFVHNTSELHQEHSFEVTNEMLEGLPEFNTAVEILQEDINYTFAWIKYADKIIVSSSVMAVAAEALGKKIDILNFGRPDFKVLPHYEMVDRIYLKGKEINKDEFYSHLKKEIGFNCPLCGHNTVKFHKALVKCTNCGLLTNTNRPSKEEILKYHENFVIGACTSEEKMQRRLRKANEQLDTIEKYVDKGRIFDIGASGGFLLKAAKDRGWEVAGNEVSKLSAKFAKDNFDIDLKYGFLEDFELEEDKYNAIVIWNVLEHLIDPIQTLKFCYHMLTDNGIIHIRVPNKNNEQLKKHYEDLHLFEFNTELLKEILRQLGFTEELVYENGWEVDLLYKKKLINKKVLITGCGRSGTNWLTEIVRASEVYKFTDVVEDRNLFDYKGLPDGYGTKLATENKGFNKDNIDKILSENPELKIVFSLRDPVNLCMAKIVRGQPKSEGGDNLTEEVAPDATVDGAIEAVEQSRIIYQHLMENYPDRVLGINLEDLIDNTENEIKHICDFLEIPFNDSMLAAHSKNRNKYHQKRYGKNIEKSQVSIKDNWAKVYNGFFKDKEEDIIRLKEYFNDIN